MSWSVDPNHTQVEFSAKHMGLMTVKGHITGVQATLDFNEDDFTASSVAATIDPTTLTTNDERRDAHLRSADFLNVEQFPTIAFKSTHIERATHGRAAAEWTIYDYCLRTSAKGARRLNRHRWSRLGRQTPRIPCASG